MPEQSPKEHPVESPFAAHEEDLQLIVNQAADAEDIATADAAAAELEVRQLIRDAVHDVELR